MAADRISNYRQVRLIVDLRRGHNVASLFVRHVSNGRQSDRLVARSIRLGIEEVSDLSSTIAALREALDRLESGEFTPPR